jgi:hypothetical protein
MRGYFAYVTNHLETSAEATQFLSGRVRGGCRFTQMCNTLFQGLAADGAKKALWDITRECYLDTASPLFGSRVMIFAHDELILEMPEEKAHEAALRQVEVGGAVYGAARGGKTGAIIGTGAGAGVGANIGSYVGGATGTTVVANRAQKKALKRAEAKGHIRRAKKNEKVGFFSGQIKPRKGKVSKAGDWKTIDQRETAQRRNRKHAAQVGAAGSLASLAGGTYLAASPEAQRSVARGIDRAHFTYKIERMFNRSSKHLPRAAGKAVKASVTGKGSGRAKVVAGLIGGGLATQATAYGAAGARNSYHQKKINERRRACCARRRCRSRR